MVEETNTNFLYAPEALHAMDSIAEKIRKTIKDKAKERTLRDNRTLVTECDVLDSVQSALVEMVQDEILLEFQKTCVRPTAEDIIAWCRCYPVLADKIRAHAAIARDWAAQGPNPPSEGDEDLRRHLQGKTQARIDEWTQDQTKSETVSTHLDRPALK